MATRFFSILPYILMPVIAMIAGGIFAAFRRPSRAVEGIVQHFAAGVVFAALTGEIIVDLFKRHPGPGYVITGFVLGVALMLGVRWLVENKLEGPGKEESSYGMILAVAIDVLTDGLLVGIGFAAGDLNGVLIAVALATEILFLGLSTAATMFNSGAKRPRVILTILALTVPILLGAVLGFTLLSGVPGQIMVAILAFATAALMYLITEELLVEAHKIPDTLFSTGVFFLGFIFIFVLEIITTG